LELINDNLFLKTLYKYEYIDQGIKNIYIYDFYNKNIELINKGRPIKISSYLPKLETTNQLNRMLNILIELHNLASYGKL